MNETRKRDFLFWHGNMEMSIGTVQTFDKVVSVVGVTRIFYAFVGIENA